jgi:DHA1 family multidrug resistance protein-like MFS transporter
MVTEEREAIERKESRIIVPQKTAEGIILVDWYSTDDPENPQNWSLSKKSWVTWVLWAYTFVVYCASAIYTPSEQGVMVAFNVGIPKAALGLSIYVLGYGFGPMLFSPLSEIPSIGRNLPYITTFTLFLLLSIPAALTPTYAGLLVTRFLTGFFGSPCLATGGATIQDLYSFTHLPYGFSAWVAANFCAPALGPLLSGFSVPALGWRWSLYEVMLMTAPALIMMWVAFPETSAANILLRRARRLRKLTGNENYKSQSEIDQANLTTKQVAIDALVKPTQIMFEDPAVFFTNIYSAFIYGVYYSFFEAFPLVYIEIYGFNVGEMGIGKLRYSPLRCSSTY